MLGVSDALRPDVAAALRCSPSSRCTCATTLDDRCKPLSGAVQQGHTWPSTACPDTSQTGHYRESPNIGRSEEHTSELQSRSDLVCRLLLEKKKSSNGNEDCGSS